MKDLKLTGYRRENGRVGVRNYVVVIPVDDISNADVIISDFLAHRELYRDKIVSARERYVYNFGKSSDIGANYIMDIYGGRI